MNKKSDFRQMFITDFVPVKQFINDERFKNQVDNPQYEKMRLDLLKQLLAKKNLTK